jgi:hypothetical protein
MDPKKQLHLKRLKESLNQIATLMSGGKTSQDVEFKTWYDQTRRSFTEIFGDGSSYCRDFLRLLFQEPRFTGGRPTGPGPRDREIFAASMKRAEAIIAAAIEEAEISAGITQPPRQEAPRPTPHLVINITNMLSQVTNVEITQLLQNLNNLGLTPSQKEEAGRLATELDAEVKGQKRWPILARCIDGLKTIGDTVYKQVAIPLLLEMLKKEMGL